MVLFWLSLCKYAAKVQIFFETAMRKVVIAIRVQKNSYVMAPLAVHRHYWCDVFIFHGGYGWTRRGINENVNDNDVFHTEGADGCPQADGWGGERELSWIDRELKLIVHRRTEDVVSNCHEYPAIFINILSRIGEWANLFYRVSNLKCKIRYTGHRG